MERDSRRPWHPYSNRGARSSRDTRSPAYSRTGSSRDTRPPAYSHTESQRDTRPPTYSQPAPPEHSTPNTIPFHLGMVPIFPPPDSQDPSYSDQPPSTTLPEVTTSSNFPAEFSETMPPPSQYSSRGPVYPSMPYGRGSSTYSHFPPYPISSYSSGGFVPPSPYPPSGYGSGTFVPSSSYYGGPYSSPSPYPPSSYSSGGFVSHTPDPTSSFDPYSSYSEYQPEEYTYPEEYGYPEEQTYQKPGSFSPPPYQKIPTTSTEGEKPTPRTSQKRKALSTERDEPPVKKGGRGVSGLKEVESQPPKELTPREDFVQAYRKSRFTHATYDKNIESILQGGLDPKYAGTDKGVTYARNPDDRKLIEDAKKTGVHLLHEGIRGNGYGSTITDYGGRPVTMRVFLTSDEVSKLVRDPQSKVARGSQQRIPPNQLKPPKRVIPPRANEFQQRAATRSRKNEILRTIATHMQTQPKPIIEELTKLYDEAGEKGEISDTDDF